MKLPLYDKILFTLSVISILLSAIVLGFTTTILQTIMSLILILLVCLFYIFDIRCTFEGQCPNWGWAKTLVYSLFLLSGSMTSLSFFY
jgi:c-di-AMP phosphodiesterase-like protein